MYFYFSCLENVLQKVLKIILNLEITCLLILIYFLIFPKYLMRFFLTHLSVNKLQKLNCKFSKFPLSRR